MIKTVLQSMKQMYAVQAKFDKLTVLSENSFQETAKLTF